jgi:calcineurin-like phosphoesterase
VVKILFVGDVVGGLGRRALLALLPGLRAEHEPAFVVVNAENAAGGLGITPKIADELFAAGVDVITLGNHAFHRREIYSYLDAHEQDGGGGVGHGAYSRAWRRATNPGRPELR